MSDDPGNPFLFLSYANPERQRALKIAAALEQAGIPIWIDQASDASESLRTATGADHGSLC